MWIHEYPGFPGFPIFPIFPLLFLLLTAIAFFIFRGWAVRRFEVGLGTAPGANQALAVLRERYARGEIDAEEYHNRKEELGR